MICVLFSENLGSSKASGSPRSATSVAPPPEQVKAAHFLPLGIPEIQINFKDWNLDNQFYEPLVTLPPDLLEWRDLSPRNLEVAVAREIE